MKRALCLLLVLVLCLGLALPAGAESPDEQMKQVTLRVKKTLGIGDEYTEFNGDSYVRGEQTWWQLTWNREGETLPVFIPRPSPLRTGCTWSAPSRR